MADTVYKFVDINGNEIEEELHCISTKHGLMCPEDKTKLSGIEEGANKYIHPDTHPATMITEDETHRFVTDEEKVTWNNNNITIDDALSYTSENPVQNKIITAELSEKIKADYVSIDSKTWTQSNITDGGFQCVYNANGIWVAGGDSSDKGLYYSTDGKSWTQSNITSGIFICVYYANGIWVVGSSSTRGLHYSLDGMTWTQSNITDIGFYCIYNANGIWVAGSNGIGLYYSTDGKSWTQSNSTIDAFYCLYNANGIWVAGSYSNGLYYSLDGMTWTQSNIADIGFWCVYNANGIWVAGSNGIGLYYSTDGMTWTQSNITDGSRFECVYNANGIWVAGGDSSDKGLYYSTDGMTWTQSNITDGDFYCLYNANGIWVAGSSDSGLHYSLDGMTWTQSNITSGTFWCVYNANGIWVAGSGSDSGLYYSESSINKTVEELQASYDNGDLLFCKIDSNIIPLTAMNTDSDLRFVFSGTINSKSYYVAVNSDNTVIYTCTELGSTDLTNIDNETFKAKVEASGFNSGAVIQICTWEDESSSEEGSNS